MTSQHRYQWIGLLSLFVAAAAARWIITPIDHPNATALRTGEAYVQLICGATCAFVAWKRSKGGGVAVG